ncbi:MAG: acyltransferase [Acidimicrobiales bacterium]|jgi:hypothetical protein|nr:acyltransferase [Acidimicrobiales bacterium]
MTPGRGVRWLAGVALLAATLAGAGPRSHPAAAAADAVGPPKIAWVQGDSVMLGAGPPTEAVLRSHGWDARVNAFGGLQLRVALDIFRQHRAEMGSAVVIELGNNLADSIDVFGQQIDEAMRLLAGTHVIWLTTSVFENRQLAVNQQIWDSARRWADAEVLDWNAIVQAHPTSTYADHLHLTPEGRSRMADAIDATLGAWYERVSRPPVHGIALRPDGRSGWSIDGAGALHPFGGAPDAGTGATWPGHDVARRVALRSDGASGWVLDESGGLHPFGGAPLVSGRGYWPGWDIARDLVVAGNGGSGWVLDGYGALHPFGGAPDVSITGYWPGWDIARAVVARDAASGWVLDGFGGLHPYGGAPDVAVSWYFSGADLARDAVVGLDGRSGYVLDLFGGLHPFGGAPAAARMPTGAWSAIALAPDGRSVVGAAVNGIVASAALAATRGATATASVDAFGGLHPSDGSVGPVGQGGPRGIATRADGAGVVVDGDGRLHSFAGMPAVALPVTWPGWDIARAIALRPDGASGWVLDGYGGLQPFGGAPATTPSAYWSGWDVARALAVTPDGAGGYVLDAFGGLHEFGTAPPVKPTAYWPGWDIARAIALRPDGRSGWVLDGWGGLHPFGGAPSVHPSASWPGHDVAVAAIADTTGLSGTVVDAWGAAHPFGP